MGDAGFFRVSYLCKCKCQCTCANEIFQGTSTDQDGRFGDKNRKLMKQLKFENVLEQKVNSFGLFMRYFGKSGGNKLLFDFFFDFMMTGRTVCISFMETVLILGGHEKGQFGCTETMDYQTSK